jgi:hypothetical protein
MMMNMTAQQKLKHLILIAFARLNDEAAPEGVTADNIDDLYESADGDDYELQDAREEVRGGQLETGLPGEYSRHYESKAVAAQYLDGSWIGWIYWYGGGKHGEPESIDWIEYADDLECTEEQKVVTVRTFALAAPK